VVEGLEEELLNYASDIYLIDCGNYFFWLGEELHNKFANRRNEWTLSDWSLRDSFFFFSFIWMRQL
jgi:hypothetical protein